MQISTNIVSLVLMAQHGLSLRKAHTINQRTLNAACSKTHSRGYLLYYDPSSEAFFPTEDASVIRPDITRHAENIENLSRGMAQYVEAGRKRGKISSIRRKSA